MFFLKGRGPWRGREKRGRRKERLITQAKMHMGLSFSALITIPTKDLKIIGFSLRVSARVDKRMGDASLSMRM